MLRWWMLVNEVGKWRCEDSHVRFHPQFRLGDLVS